MSIVPWFTVVLSAWLAALCAAADGALLSLDPDESLTPGQRALFQRRERAHRALAFARVMAHLGAGMSIAAAAGLTGRGVLDSALIGGVAALILVGSSEAFARSYGSVLGPRGVDQMSRFISAVEYVLAPVASLGGWFDAVLYRILPPPSHPDEDREVTAEQFKQVVASEAEVSKDQEVLLNGVFRLGRTTIEEIMVPRVDMVTIDSEAPWSEVVERFRSSEHARLPIYAGTIDNVTGVLYAKDLLPDIVAGRTPDAWTTRARPAVFIPSGKTADEQLRDFQASGTHIAIVADEFGGTAGLVTIEDVLEEIVGDIRDEYDVEESRVEQEDDDRYWVSGRLTLDELSELLGADFRREDVSTVGGLVYEGLGRVPRAGDRFQLNGFKVVVEQVSRRRVKRVFFERLIPAHQAEAER